MQEIVRSSYNSPLRFRFQNKLDADYIYYYPYDLVMVKPVSRKALAQFRVIDWQVVTINFRRNMDTFGIDQAFTSPHTFPLASAKVINTLLAAGGTQAYCKFIIEKLNRSSYEYEEIYAGQLDFATYKSNKDWTEIQSFQRGLPDELKAIENTDFDVPLVGPYVEKVYIDGLQLLLSYTYLGATTQQTSGNTFQNNNPPNLVFYNKEGDYSIGDAYDMSATGGAYNNNKLLVVAVDCTATFESTFNAYFKNNLGSTQNGRLRLNIHIYANGDVNVPPRNAGDTELWLSDSFVPGQFGNIPGQSFSKTYNLVAGDLVAVFFDVKPATGSSTGADTFDFEIETNWDFVIKTTFRLFSSVAGGFRYPNLIREFLKIALDNKYDWQSAYLSNKQLLPQHYDSIPQREFVTSGDALRRLNGSKIRLSWGDIANDLFVRHGLGIGLNTGKVVIEPLAYFLQKDSVILTLDRIDDFRVEPAFDLMANDIKIGYNDQTYDSVNGRDEFNLTQQYKFNVLQQAKNLEYISDFRADMHGIERTRANLTKKDTTDSKDDNQTFLLSITLGTETGSGGYYLRRAATVTGLTSGVTAYNLALSPKRSFYRLRKYFNSVMYGLKDQVAKWLWSSKNFAVTSNVAAGVISESADMNFNSNSDILFKPYYILVTGLVSDQNTALAAIKSNPYGVVRTIIKTAVGRSDVVVDGFIVDVGCKIGTGNKAVWDFKLLCSPESDIFDAIDAFQFNRRAQ